MATNKFATILHRNTHKMAVILVYTILEWTLIALLLLNALFSYLIAKFASFFGLHPPCIFCSRVDHVLEPGRSYRDLLCDAHADEVSRLGYCSHHRRLAEASSMCEDCSSSGPAETADPAAALLSWMKRSESGEKDLRCSCCDVILESGFYSPYLLLKPSWDVLEITQKGNLVGKEFEEVPEGFEEGRVLDPVMEKEEEVVYWDGGDTGLEGELKKDEAEAGEDGKVGAFLSEQEQQGMALCYSSDTCVLVDDASVQVLTECSEKVLDLDDERLIPGGLIELSMLINDPASPRFAREDDEELGHELEVMDRVIEMVDIVEEQPPLPPAEESIGGCSTDHQFVEAEAIHEIPGGGVDVEVHASAVAGDSGEVQGVAPGDESKTMDAETSHEISIGSEVCDQEHVDQSHLEEPVSMRVGIEANYFEEERASETLSSIDGIHAETNCEISIGSEVCDQEHINQSHPEEPISMRVGIEVNDFEEERAPETPSSIYAIHALNKRFFYERRESTPDSLDGSITSEIEGSETITMDRLKAALDSERKALSALYAELEEERSASAVAANQTMAMITRLQEEKSAMQMEALQYQRMMEEQSEYDQEALQLLNDLMTKREKEKKDLEKELEVYRKRVLLYEARERRKVGRITANGRSVASSASSSGEDSDDISFDCHEGDDCFNGLDDTTQSSPLDAVLRSRELPEAARHLHTLDEFFGDFEEEDEENGHLLDGNYSHVINGVSDEVDTNGKFHSEGRSMAFRGKRLLPLFDAISMENGDEPCAKSQETDASDDHKKFAIAEEVDSMFERTNCEGCQL